MLSQNKKELQLAQVSIKELKSEKTLQENAFQSIVDEAIKTNEGLENDLKKLKGKYRDEVKHKLKSEDEAKRLQKVNEMLDKKLTLYVRNELRLINEIKNYKERSDTFKRAQTTSYDVSEVTQDIQSPNNRTEDVTSEKTNEITFELGDKQTEDVEVKT